MGGWLWTFNVFNAEEERSTLPSRMRTRWSPLLAPCQIRRRHVSRSAHCGTHSVSRIPKNPDRRLQFSPRIGPSSLGYPVSHSALTRRLRAAGVCAHLSLCLRISASVLSLSLLFFIFSQYVHTSIHTRLHIQTYIVLAPLPPTSDLVPFACAESAFYRNNHMRPTGLYFRVVACYVLFLGYVDDALFFCVDARCCGAKVEKWSVIAVLPILFMCACHFTECMTSPQLESTAAGKIAI